MLDFKTVDVTSRKVRKMTFPLIFAIFLPICSVFHGKEILIVKKIFFNFF